MSDDTTRVRVTGRQFRHDGEQFERGDELTVPESVLESWHGRLDRVEEPADSDDDGEPDVEEPADETDGEAAVEVDPHPSDMTVAEIEERVQDVDDLALLEGIRDEEAANEDRTTALEAIDERIDELEG